MLQTIVFNTKFGNFTLPQNDRIILHEFKNGGHWGESDIDFFLSIIDKNKNILEYGSHVGTHTIPYAKFIGDTNVVYSFEPQYDLYKLLLKNLFNNNVLQKVIHQNASLFYYSGEAKMNSHFVDGDYLGSVTDSKELGVDCNYGGLTLGADGEKTSCYKMDDIDFQNLGFIHSDAQGCDNIIFWGGRETIAKHKPIIYYEDSNFDERQLQLNTNIYLETIKKNYDIPNEALSFDVANFCIHELGYKTFKSGFNSYLIP